MVNQDAIIANLQARMDTVERDTERIQAQMNTLSSAMSDSALENEKMSGEIRWIRQTLEGMAQKKIRAVDVAMVIGGLIIGTISAYTSIQMVELTKAMMAISQAVN